MANMGKKTKSSDMEEPVLELGLELYLFAYHNLDTERSHANGPCPVPWSKIEYYAERNHFDERQTEELHFFVQKMDEFELDRVRRIQEQERRKAQKAKK